MNAENVKRAYAIFESYAEDVRNPWLPMPVRLAALRELEQFVDKVSECHK